MTELPKDLTFRPSRDETYIAFAAAIDAWSKVEWQMVFLFNSVNTPNDFNKSGSILISIIGIQAQLRVIEAAARTHLREHEELLREVERTTEKIGKKATIRNRIIHGRWRDSHYFHEGKYSHTELERVFSVEQVFGPTYKTQQERRALAGKFLFDKSELEKATEMFERLSRTIFDLQLRIVSTFVPRLG
ncbi:hypothetical protein RFN25_02505 [Mesorhizobium abyssinicae]|uniref:hypothetical protein n=1 Tax=Mesorhizobium abyssinicae TaxID=1209958 RepID=UPI002A242EA9|nr:hypothetical protein [Mesorhizobium abyssinicae]MDX8432301.1 hypothetical protein [Mesorhizobium abyssinicae]